MSFVLAIIFTFVLEFALEYLEHKYENNKVKLTVLNRIYKGKKFIHFYLSFIN
jgi:hypothetical protein